MNIKKNAAAGVVLAVASVTSAMTIHPKLMATSDDSHEPKTSSVTIVKDIPTNASGNVESATAEETITETSETVTEAETTIIQTEAPTVPLHELKLEKIPSIEAKNVQVTPASVSSLKVTWDAEEDRYYQISWYTEAPYSENVQVIFKENGTAYLTGLRENSEYTISVEPIPTEEEGEIAVLKKDIVCSTPAIEVIQDFEREDGWTSCFAGERASGLTAMPSSGAIYGSEVDAITDTGIRRFENGDYACAMGTHYGYCGDRFLVELDNGIQFTCRICDSKGCGDVQDEYGGGLYHWFGGEGNGKCIIEFIYDDYNLPSCVSFSGSWGYYDWNGLNLCSNIKSIQKLATW